MKSISVCLQCVYESTNIDTVLPSSYIDSIPIFRSLFSLIFFLASIAAFNFSTWKEKISRVAGDQHAYPCTNGHAYDQINNTRKVRFVQKTGMEFEINWLWQFKRCICNLTVDK